MERIIVAGVLTGALLYGTALHTNFDPAVKAKLAEAFGSQVLGMPVEVGWTIIESVLILPLLLLMWHFIKIAQQAMLDNDGYFVGTVELLIYLFTAGKEHPELRKSQLIVIRSGLYMIMLAAARIAYTEYKHI